MYTGRTRISEHKPTPSYGDADVEAKRLNKRLNYYRHKEEYKLKARLAYAAKKAAGTLQRPVEVVARREVTTAAWNDRRKEIKQLMMINAC